MASHDGNLTPSGAHDTVVCQAKKLYQQRFGEKNSYTNQITHTPPPKKSNGRPLKNRQRAIEERVPFVG